MKKTVELFFYNDGNENSRATNKMPDQQSDGMWDGDDGFGTDICEEGLAIFGLKHENLNQDGKNVVVRVTLNIENIQVAKPKVEFVNLFPAKRRAGKAAKRK